MKPLTEIRKGCLKNTIDKGSNEEHFCDDFHGLCPTCQALLEQAQEFEKIILEIFKIIENAGLEDVIGFLNGLKDFTINEGHPFGTCDYMAMDDMIVKLNKLMEIEKELGVGK
jgi:hypothetical protein